MKIEYFDFLVTFVIEFQDGFQETHCLQSTQSSEQMAIADSMCRLAKCLSKHEQEYFFVITTHCENRGYCGVLDEDNLLHLNH